MVATKQPLIFLLLLCHVTFFFITNSSSAADCLGHGAISVYWGQSSTDDEGTLLQTCKTGLYDIVILQGLDVYDDGRTPKLNLQDHCGTDEYPCYLLQPEIEYCQRNNIKVFLAVKNVIYVGQRNTTTSSNGEIETKVANYLLKNYLSRDLGPLGTVSLDGIGLSYVLDTPNLRFDRLAVAVKESTTARNIDFAVTVQCLPDIFVGTAIQSGLTDYVWIEIFAGYNCYSEDGDFIDGILDQWKYWTEKASHTLFFLDVSPEPKGSFSYSYVSPDALKSGILPAAKETSNYGGVMIRQRHEDIKYNYAGQIRNTVRKVCKCTCDKSASTRFYPRSLQNV